MSLPNALATISASLMTEHGSSAPTLNASFREVRTFGAQCDPKRHVVDRAGRAGLRAVAENRHFLPTHHLVHEDSGHVAIAVAEILPLAVDIVRTKDNVIELELCVRGLVVQFDCIFLKSRTNPWDAECRIRKPAKEASRAPQSRK